MSRAPQRHRLFSENPLQRFDRLLKEEEESLSRAEKSLLAGSMTFSLQQVHQGKDAIHAIKKRIKRLKYDKEHYTDGGPNGKRTKTPQ